jgi:hypothetical protein
MDICILNKDMERFDNVRERSCAEVWVRWFLCYMYLEGSGETVSLYIFALFTVLGETSVKNLCFDYVSNCLLTRRRASMYVGSMRLN